MIDDGLRSLDMSELEANRLKENIVYYTAQARNNSDMINKLQREKI
jgi:hypothetical protein